MSIGSSASSLSRQRDEPVLADSFAVARAKDTAVTEANFALAARCHSSCFQTRVPLRERPGRRRFEGRGDLPAGRPCGG